MRETVLTKNSTEFDFYSNLLNPNLITPNNISNMTIRSDSNQLTYSFNYSDANLYSYILDNFKDLLSIINSIPTLINNFCAEHILISGAMLGVLTGLIIGSPWIRFKTEKIIRSFLFLPLLEVNLKTKEIYCKDGIILLHGISLRNKMWFTNTIPNTFCLTKVTLNWSTLCNHVGSILWDKDHELLTTDEYRTNLYNCLIKQTADPSKRNTTLYRVARTNLFIFIEEVKTDKEIALNEIRMPGKFYLNSRNLMPELEPGWKDDLQIGSYDFGEIAKYSVEIPKTIVNQPSISRSQLNKTIRPRCLFDIGGMLRWPVRLKIKRYKLFYITKLRRYYSMFKIILEMRKKRI